MPSAASSSIQAAAKSPLETSSNTPPDAGGGAYAAPCLDFRRNTAMCARVTRPWGQRLPFPQPAVTPLAASVWIASWNMLERGTSKNSKGPGVLVRMNALNSGPVGAGAETPLGDANVNPVRGTA